MKRNINAVTSIAVTAFLAVAVTGCAKATAATVEERPTVQFEAVRDVSEHRWAEQARAWAEERNEILDESQREAAEAAEEQEPEYVDETWYYEPQNASYSVMGNADGLNSFDGVYDFDGHHETFYASHAVYDDQLWVDDDGFFRDDQGRYVVASSDYEHGTEIEISQGTAVVMDDGCESGTIDVHTTWGR